MELLLGYIGLFNMVALSPVLFYQIAQSHLSDLTWIVFGFLVVKGLLDNVLSDYLWARAVVLTSATVATVGLGLTIPLAFISDFFWMGQPDDQVISITSVTGALSVLAGFVLVNVGNESEEDQDHDDNDREEDELDSNPEPLQMTEIKAPVHLSHTEHQD
jgi:solute carrier family 35, member F5